MDDLKIAVGILTYQRTDLLIDTLSCLENDIGIELVIVNNNDFCVKSEILKSMPANSSLIYCWDGKNHGVSSGRALIVENTTADILILLDDDVYIDNFQGIINSVIDEFSKDSSLGACAFNIKEFSTGLNNRYEIPHKNKHVDVSKDFLTYLIIGAGNALRVDAVKEVGSFAKDFGLYGFEEIDLAFRLINSGSNIKYKSDCVVYHKKSPDGRFSSELVNYLYFVNRVRMAKRYFKLRYYVTCLLVRSVHLVVNTKNPALLIRALRVVFTDKKSNPFGQNFYNYIKRVDGFIWY